MPAFAEAFTDRVISYHEGRPPVEPPVTITATMDEYLKMSTEARSSVDEIVMGHATWDESVWRLIARRQGSE